MQEYKVNLDAVLGHGNYKGTCIHNLIMDTSITTTNLVYALAIIIACGGDFYAVKDSNGITAYALLTRTRYPGQSCLSLEIYSEITSVVERCRLNKTVLVK